MPDPALLLIAAATFALAGAVKGVIGLGLPTVSLAVLAVATDLHQAMALLLVPSFVTNLWQAVAGGNAGVLLRRLWPFLLAATLAVWPGALALTRVDVSLLSALLGVLLAAYAAVSLAGVRIAVAARDQTRAGLLAGVANGVLTGMTGSFVVPGVLYLQSIGLPRDALIQAMGMLFTASTVALAVALSGNRLLSAELGVVSALGVLPALAGMVLGQHLRRRLSESAFRKVFFVALLALGGYIVVRAW